MTTKTLFRLLIGGILLLPLSVVFSQTRDGANAPDRPPIGGVPGRPPFDQPNQAPRNNLAPPQSGATSTISRRQAADLAHDNFRGRVLSVRIDEGNWRVRIDQNGTVFNVVVDGRTGEVERSPE